MINAIDEVEKSTKDINFEDSANKFFWFLS